MLLIVLIAHRSRSLTNGYSKSPAKQQAKIKLGKKKLT